MCCEEVRAEQHALTSTLWNAGLLCFGVWWQESRQEEKSSFKNMGIRKASHLF